ncbi:hypothetical protein LINPERHAP1_LOCUS2065 [Linum perenne]
MAKGTKEKEREMVTKSSMAILLLQAPLPKVVGFNPSSSLQFAPEVARVDDGRKMRRGRERCFCRRLNCDNESNAQISTASLFK